MNPPQPIVLRTDDGLALEGEIAIIASSITASSITGGAEPRTAIVLCHPHPQFGGTMRSLVTSVLFAELSDSGYPCLRFNFRGVEGSEGAHTHGELERLDVAAAITALAAAVPGAPLALVGWSFGADVSLAVTDPRLAGWIAIAPPLRVFPTFGAASDARPKHLVLAEHDEYRDPSDVQTQVAGWTATTTAVVPGASHFFVGRTDRVVSETRAGIDRLTRID